MPFSFLNHEYGGENMMQDMSIDELNERLSKTDKGPLYFCDHEKNTERNKRNRVSTGGQCNMTTDKQFERI